MQHLTQLAQYVKRRFLPLDHDPTDDVSEGYYAALYLDVLRRHVATLPTSPAVLDVGCGTGRIAVPLAQAGCRITGVDHHRATIRIAHENCRAAGVEMSIVDQDISDFLQTSPTEPFDAGLAIEALYVVPDLAGNVARIASRVKSGGLMFITHRPRYYYMWWALANGNLDDAALVSTSYEGRLLKGKHRAYYNWQSAEEIARIYDAAGADIIEQHPIGPYSGILTDPTAQLCDPATLTADERQTLAQVERTVGAETLMASRYVLVVARVR